MTGATLLLLTIGGAPWNAPRVAAGDAPESQAAEAADSSSVLARSYVEGQTLSYHMNAVNDHAGNKRRYQADALAVVRQGSTGFYEEVKWSNLQVNGSPVHLRDDFRQLISLDPDYPLSIPNMSAVDPQLVGPVADLLTFYADLRLAARQGLSHPGDHVYVNRDKTNSWADGRHFKLAEDAIDFDLTLKSMDTSRRIATVVIRHVPPRRPGIRMVAQWMMAPAGIGPNNWVQVADDSGKYVAAVGSEMFEVVMQVSLADGRVLSASMENPVEVLERDCTDAALTDCGEARRYRILRQVELKQVR